jgi:dUTP pyrophosphatase
MNLNIKKLHQSAIVPAYASEGAACFDLHAIVDIEDDESEEARRINTIRLLPDYEYHFRTGLAFEVPPGWVLKIYSRSGHGFKNSTRLLNCVGVIDSDYRGEVLVGLRNDGGNELPVRHGDRIAQAMLERVERVTFTVVDQLSDTARGAGGFGSTGTGAM